MGLNTVADLPDLSQVNLDLGYRLKTLREAFGLSQRELAKRAGVTNSNISMIEQGQVSPSVQSLSKILDAFPVSLSEFFSSNLLVDESPVINAKNIEEQTDLSGISTKKLQIDPSLPQLVRQIFLPGVGGMLQPADHDLIGWILSGELVLQLGTRSFSLKSGDAFRINKNQIFCFANHHSQETEILIASSIENR